MTTTITPTPGFTSHQESTTTILIPTSANSTETPEVFINPVQEYNRDLSIAAIRAWSSIRDDEFIARRNAKLTKSKKPTKKGKGKLESTSTSTKRALIPDQSETNSSEKPIEEGSDSKKVRLDDSGSEKPKETEPTVTDENQAKSTTDVVNESFNFHDSIATKSDEKISSNQILPYLYQKRMVLQTRPVQFARIHQLLNSKLRNSQH